MLIHEAVLLKKIVDEIRRRPKGTNVVTIIFDILREVERDTVAQPPLDEMKRLLVEAMRAARSHANGISSHIAAEPKPTSTG